MLAGLVSQFMERHVQAAYSLCFAFVCLITHAFQSAGDSFLWNRFLALNRMTPPM